MNPKTCERLDRAIRLLTSNEDLTFFVQEGTDDRIRRNNRGTSRRADHVERPEAAARLRTDAGQ